MSTKTLKFQDVLYNPFLALGPFRTKKFIQKSNSDIKLIQHPYSIGPPIGLPMGHPIGPPIRPPSRLPRRPPIRAPMGYPMNYPMNYPIPPRRGGFGRGRGRDRRRGRFAERGRGRGRLERTQPLLHSPLSSPKFDETKIDFEDDERPRTHIPESLSDMFFRPDVCSALCIILDEQTDYIQKIRKEYDPAYSRWMPHINFLFPFISERKSNQFLVSLQEEIKKLNIGKFKITLKKFSTFSNKSHAREQHIFLDPIDENNELQLIYDKLKQLFPTIVTRPQFHPHLTCAKVAKNKVNTLKDEFQKNFKEGIAFECNRLSYITRGRSTPFKIHTHIYL